MSVKGALLATLFMMAATGCARPEEAAVRPEQVTDFGELFKANCAGCHGADGRQGVAQALNDPLFLALVNDARLREVISNGVPGTPMTAFAKEAGGLLTNEQVQALADGMKHQWGSAHEADESLPAYSDGDAVARGVGPGDPERGRKAFAGYCARCHGADGRGGTNGGSVVDEAFLTLASRQSLRTTIIAGHSAQGISGWRDYAAGRTMTSQEISDVVAWLSTHRGNHD